MEEVSWARGVQLPVSLRANPLGGAEEDLLEKGSLAMRWKRISDAVVRRLPLYLRVLEEAHDQQLMSSQELGARAGVSSALVRKDLAWFGEFGKQGVGYETAYLKDELRKILNLDKPLPLILVGVGSLGHALVRYFRRRFLDDPNFTLELVGLFDIDADVIGQEVEGIVVQPLSEMTEMIEQHQVRMAILTVPADAAQQVVDSMVDAGIKAILNFAPVKLTVPEDVELADEDLSLELQRLAYYVLD
ncbi:MAG: redox-sensing transcriptional repressor Rex [Firmicutes bacterium]|nr:redox-sensing transcriptional repressor Rex [Bacillota bacterium]